MITIDGGTGTILHNGVEIASDKMYDQWRLNVNETITAAGEVVTDWERPTETGTGSYLTGMSHSSGVFTFPVTGIWRIDFYGYWGIGASDSDHNLRSYIQTTVNNASYSAVQEQVQSIKSDSTYTYQGWFQTFVFDVTNTSNCKCRFVLNPSGSNVYYKADASPPKTGALFMRLGDT